MGTASLKDVTVVALEQAVAAPLCTARLADAGARVIKIERKEGDFARAYDHVAHGESAYFVWLNRGKESITLDIKAPEDARLLWSMIEGADVFIQNLAPGAASRAGFGSRELRSRDPRLVTCDITGYGDTGPYADMKAYDFLIQCETGLASITGVPGEPSRVGISIADICCGVNAHAAILQALFERERTGVGKEVAISLFASLAEWMAVPLLHHDYAGRSPERMGLNHATIAPYGAYRTGDGGEIVFAVQSEREWRSLCTHVLRREELSGDPLFASNALRCANRTTMDVSINAVLTRLTKGELIQRLRQANIAYGALNSIADLSRHPQLRRVEVPTPTGPVSLPAPPLCWADEPFQARPVPDLNEHGSALRREFSVPSTTPGVFPDRSNGSDAGAPAGPAWIRPRSR